MKYKNVIKVLREISEGYSDTVFHKALEEKYSDGLAETVKLFDLEAEGCLQAINLLETGENNPDDDYAGVISYLKSCKDVAQDTIKRNNTIHFEKFIGELKALEAEINEAIRVLQAVNSRFIKVKFKSNWADEMDIEGFEIVSREDFFKKYNKIKKIKGPVGVCIGTNEQIEYHAIEGFLNDIAVEGVSDEFAQLYNKEVGPVGFIATKLFKELFGEFDSIDFDED